MSQVEDGWTAISIREVTLEKLKKFVKLNPVFKNPTNALEYAVDNLVKDMVD